MTTFAPCAAGKHEVCAGELVRTSEWREGAGVVVEYCDCPCGHQDVPVVERELGGEA